MYFGLLLLRIPIWLKKKSIGFPDPHQPKQEGVSPLKSSVSFLWRNPRELKGRRTQIGNRRNLQRKMTKSK